MSVNAGAPEIVHSLPGRIRVYLPAWTGGGQRRIEQRIRAMQG